MIVKSGKYDEIRILAHNQMYEPYIDPIYYIQEG